MAQYIPGVEVLEPASNTDLVTLEQVKAYLNITTTADDARLQALITFSSGVISNICDRVFALEKVAETIILVGTPGGINLSRWPVREIESVVNAGITLDSTQVTLDYLAGILHGTPLTGDTVITYKGGYALPDEAPENLSLACIDVIRATYYLGSRDPSMQSISDNATGSIRFFPPPGMSRTGASTGKGSPLSPTAMSLIMPFRRLPLA